MSEGLEISTTCDSIRSTIGGLHSEVDASLAVCEIVGRVKAARQQQFSEGVGLQEPSHRRAPQYCHSQSEN